MQCPFCGSTDLLPKFKFCPECAEPLPRANVPKEDQDAGRTEQPSPPGNNGGFEVDNKQRQGINQEKEAPTKETEQGQSLTTPAHGATRKPAVEQGVTPTKSDQHLEGSTAPTPSSPQVEETVDSKLTTVQKEPNTTPPANGVKAELTSEGQKSSVSKEIHSGGNELSTSSAVVALSPSHTTGHEVQDVRGPAELDESNPPDRTPQEPPASQALSVINEQKQGNEVKVVGEKKLTESRQGSLSDPTATPSSENGSSTNNASSPKEPQQNQRESHDHLGSASNRKDNQIAGGSVEVQAGPVTRQAAKRNEESAAPSSSLSAGTTEPTTEHPLKGPENDGNGAEAIEVNGTTPGTWYQKKNTQQDENTGKKKGKKNQKKEGKDKSNSEPSAPLA